MIYKHLKLESECSPDPSCSIIIEFLHSLGCLQPSAINSKMSAQSMQQSL